MRQQEAEQEAARRNAEDERRDRFVFYALDHSAGVAEDAWEVEMRLRSREDEPVAAGISAAAGPATQPFDVPGAEDFPGADNFPGADAPPSAPVPVEPAGPDESAEPGELAPPADAPAAPSQPLQPAPAVRATDPDLVAPPRPRRLRRPRLIQIWGGFVILVGLTFVAATLLLSVGLRDYTHFGAVPTSVGVGLGLIAVCVGIALVRTG